MTWTIRLVNVASASMAMARKEARKSIFAHPHQWGSEARGGGAGERCDPVAGPLCPRRWATCTPAPSCPEARSPGPAVTRLSRPAMRPQPPPSLPRSLG